MILDALKSYSRLFKFRIVSLLVFAAVVSAFIASDGRVSLQGIAVLIISGATASIGSAFLNNYFDRDIDAIAERTKDRPIPSGDVNPQVVLYSGVFLIAAALLVSSASNYLVTLFILLGALAYVVVYTLWLKRRTPLNIVLGGLSGAFAVLAGWSVVGAEFSLTTVLIALVLFQWTPSHFWSFAIFQMESYEKTRIPMLPTVVGVRKASEFILLNTILLSAISVALYFLGPFGLIYLVASLVLGALFISWNVKLIKNPSRIIALSNYKFSGIYLVLLFAAMLLDIGWRAL